MLTDSVVTRVLHVIIVMHDPQPACLVEVAHRTPTYTLRIPCKPFFFFFDCDSRVSQHTLNLGTCTVSSSSRRGLALCPLCHPAWALEAHWWVPARTPTVHWGPNNGGEAVGGPKSQTGPVTHKSARRTHRTDTRRTW